MKTNLRNLFLMVAFSYVVETGISCAAGVAAAIFIPLLGASAWVNPAVPNAANTFFFFDITEKSNTSTFNGNENLPNGGQAHFTGSFTNHDIQFVYDNTLVSKKGTYKGFINDASTQIDLTGSDGLPPITLKKQ
jgi:polyisoprenoid-binding protein YceI